MSKNYLENLIDNHICYNHLSDLHIYHLIYCIILQNKNFKLIADIN